MVAATTLALMLGPSRILTAQGFTPDPWQRALLLDPSYRILLLCSRGAGKSRTTSRAQRRSLVMSDAPRRLANHLTPCAR